MPSDRAGVGGYKVRVRTHESDCTPVGAFIGRYIIRVWRYFDVLCTLHIIIK